MARMRLGKREVLDPCKIRQLLEECQVLRIGTVDSEGMFIVPVNYGYEYEEEGRQQQVAVELDRVGGLIRGSYTCQYSMAFESLMGTGTIRLLKGEEKLRGLELLMRHMAPESDLSFRQHMVDAVHVYEICVEEFRVKKREPKEEPSL